MQSNITEVSPISQMIPLSLFENNNNVDNYENNDTDNNDNDNNRYCWLREYIKYKESHMLWHNMYNFNGQEKSSCD